jgi:predicted  nucleic acid-binding Zn-ribbon protein
LQTKIGHAELARNEAVEALAREREIVSRLRSEAEGWEARLKDAEDRAKAADDTANECQEEVAAERQARKAAEKALRAAESARDAAEQLVRALSEEASRPAAAHRPGQTSPGHVSSEQTRYEPARAEAKRAETPRRGGPVAEPEVAAANMRRQRPVENEAPEPEPVKWWLNTKAGPKRK